MKTSQARVVFQILLHVALVAHVVAYYVLDWRSVGALDFQSFFRHFLGEGLVTAGALLTLVVYATALLFGRLFCSWGCHFGATQDFAAWLLRKLGWKAPVVRTRFLHWAPWAILVMIFLLPQLRRWQRGEWALKVDLAAVAPWDTLPGYVLSIVTFLCCGMGILLFLGSRGFCRFVCPYGALFRVTEWTSLFRVRRVAGCRSNGGIRTVEADVGAANDATGGDGGPLNHVCGGAPLGASGTRSVDVAPCTAACPTAIDVHRETTQFGAVRSLDCVRCHLCIEACPQNALAYSARNPSSRRSPEERDGAETSRAPEYTLPLWGELVVAASAVTTFLLVDLLYGGHFLAATLAFGHGFMLFTLIRLVSSRQEFTALGRPLVRDGRWTWTARLLATAFLISLVPLFEAAAFRYSVARALALDPGAHSHEVSELVKSTPESSATSRQRLREASAYYQRALAYFPRHRRTRQLLLSAYARLRDPRAVPLAEALVRDAGKADREARQTLAAVYLLFGRSEAIQDVVPKEDATN